VFLYKLEHALCNYLDDPTTVGVTEGFGLMFYNARWYDLS
jgi:hypothetical protein